MRSKTQYYSWLDYIFLASVFFPFIGFKEYDSQPWPFFVAAIYLLVNYSLIKSADHVSNILAWIVFFFALSISAAQSFQRMDFHFLRSMAMYVSIPVFYYSSLIFVRRKKIERTVMDIISGIWIMAGAVQVFHPTLFSDFVNVRTSGNRGVTSLSPEPGNFATILIFLSLIYALVGEKKVAITANVASIILLAKSALGVIYLIVAATVAAVLHSKKFFIIFLCGSLILILNIDGDIESDLRMVNILMVLVSSPGSLLEEDLSTMSRLSDTILPFLVAAHNQFLPNPLNSYSEAALEYITQSGNNIFLHTGTNIIKSWHGYIAYELGFGIIPLIFIFYLQPRFRMRSRVGVLAISVFIISFSAIPISFPPLYFLLAHLRVSNSSIKN